MDYEKRYEEILEKLRGLRVSWVSTNNRAAKEIEEAIPELIESEDERIRKEIIDFATKANNGVTSILANNYNFNKWIALIEKQAEQKTAEWSEEDESKIKGIINTLEGLYDNAASDTTKDLYRAKIDFLKSLKERVQHQNMWISVDKEVYIKEPILAQKKDKSDVWEGYTVIADHTLDPLVYERYINIENISTQSLWKPSEGQLECLDYAIKKEERDYSSLTGNRIYLNLKCLREELEKLKD